MDKGTGEGTKRKFGKRVQANPEPAGGKERCHRTKKLNTRGAESKQIRHQSEHKKKKEVRRVGNQDLY